MNDFMAALQKNADQALPNVSITENGAVGYQTSGKKLLDLNFMLSSMRNMNETEIWDRFLDAYNENPMLAIIWLFFARDCREGTGERRTFRVIFKRLCWENGDAAIKLLNLIPFYGRWDDLLDVIYGKVPCNIRDAAYHITIQQFVDDLKCADKDKNVSLLGKWLPSPNTSSAETRRRAEEIRCAMGMTPKQYRKALAKLRKQIGVVERQMSANQWELIDYESVPSRAAMNYRNAFWRHDPGRYEDYINDVSSGKAKIHSGVLYPYDIVHAYNHVSFQDRTLEEQWKALPDKVPENGSTLVVVDGSGSMCVCVGNSDVSCHDVANSLGIYFAEKLKGPYHNSFITFSANPKYVHFDNGLSLYSKICIMNRCNECSNTDIVKVFDLVLDTAVKNHLKQSELPSNVLIVSDMEFDDATYRGGWGWQQPESGPVNQHLFDVISERFAVHGYHLPRLIFWNVCSRTGTIPVTQNDFGVTLVSGFSPNIADMVMSSKLDPYEALVDKLMSDRYTPVKDALRE